MQDLEVAALREPDVVSPALRRSWQDHDVVALWESENGALPPRSEKARIWRWDQMRAILLETAKITLPSIIERRVMQLVNTTNPAASADATSGLLNGALQALMPGEHARPHRHTMNAIRFILEGMGAETIVEGKACRMEPGDLVTTPGWTWHEHQNRGSLPTLWVDILDVAVQRALGTAAFQPGPIAETAGSIDDAAFAAAGIVPAVKGNVHSYSPIFRYPWADAVRALAAAPAAADGSRRVRYVDPLSGGAILPTIDCHVVEIAEGVATDEEQSSASAICVVVEGEGQSTIGGETVTWRAKDLFTVPQQAWASHHATGGTARIFVASTRELYRRLGLLTEQVRHRSSTTKA